MVKCQKTPKTLHQQKRELEQKYHIATFQYSYSSSQTVELHPLLRIFKDLSTPQL